MKQKVIIAVVAAALLSGAAMTQKVDAAIPVIDAENIAQAVSTVANTLTQIQNQLLELQPLDLQVLQSQINGITQQINQIQSTSQQSQGLMNQAQSVEQKWQQTFGNMDTIFNNQSTITPGAQIANSRNTAYTLDQTYQDAYRVAKQAATLDQDWQTLQQLMNSNQNAVGNKQSMQIQNSLIAQQNGLILKQIQTLSALNSVIAAGNAAQNREDAQTTAQNQQLMNAFDAHQAKGNPLDTRTRGLL